VAQADIVAAGRATHQVVAVNEIHFDAPTQMLAGAVLFDQEGKLVGILGAISGAQQNVASANTTDFIHLQAVTNNAATKLSNFGPSGLQEAFALSPVILSRVVSGFRSADHLVKHPALGATCADAVNSNGVSVGALVKQVTPESAAAKAGLEEGDIIVLIDGAIVNNPIDYAWNMLNKEVGQDVRVTIRRGDSVQELKVTVGNAVVSLTRAAQKKSATQHPGPEKS
jgi:S1-C subfamily serine protease